MFQLFRKSRAPVVLPPAPEPVATPRTPEPVAPDPLHDPQEYYNQHRRMYDANLKRVMDDRYLRSPRLLSIETYVKCNATCEFCPYPGSSRIGQRMETETIQKIIDEVASSGIPPLYFVPARINEPMFDKRMYDIFDYAGRKLPETKIGHFTNGTTLNERNTEHLASLPNLGFINVSLNSHEPEEHKALMGIDFEIVVKNLRALHALYEARMPLWFVTLTRVGSGTSRDTDFVRWCKENFPLFQSRASPRFDWFGKTHAMDMGSQPAGCAQWFQLDFLANGREAFCCMDDDGRFGLGDARTEHALDIYNHPTRLALREQKLRTVHPVCAKCHALI